MAPGPYSFIDVAVLDEVRVRFAAGDALAILTIDLQGVVWANGPGAALFGYPDIEAVMGAPSGLGLPARRQISSAPGFPDKTRDRQVMVRLGKGLGRIVPVVVSGITMPDGEAGVLIAVAQMAGAKQTAGNASRIIEGFEEAGYFAAFLDGDAEIEAASRGFADLDIPAKSLVELVAEVAGESGRLVKRMVPARNGLIPAGIARLTDEPRLHLLIAVDEAVAESVDDLREQDAPEYSASENELDELPLPSDADLPERVEEDSALGEEAATADQPQAPAESEADEWYFDPADSPPSPKTESADVPATRPDYKGTAPIRFIWRTDADGAINSISNEFVAAVRHSPEQLIGKLFTDVAAQFDLDPDHDITALLERRDTWSGRTVLWPIAGTDLRAPVDLAALPAYNRDRGFEGFRGFGVIRLAESIVDPAARGMEPAQRADAGPDKAISNDGSGQAGDDPFQGEVPVISIAQTRERRTSDKVIRLAERRPLPAGSMKQLSPGERNAFEEIRTRLRDDYTAAREKSAAERAADDAKSEAQPEDSAPPEETPLEEVTATTDTKAPEPSEPVSIDDDAPESAPLPAESATIEAPPIATEGFIPSAFAVARGSAGIDADVISGLPLPLLVHAGDELYFANRDFLALTGYASLDQIRNEGGLDRLFVEHKPEDDADDDHRKLHLRTFDGDEFPVDAHLQSIRWQDRSALLLSLRRVEAPAPVVPVEAALPAPEQEELEGRVTELRAIIDTATDGVVLITREGTIRNISRPAEALFGVDSADVEGKAFASLFAMESQRAARDYLNGLAENGVASVLNDGREVIGREAEGRFIPLFMSIGRLPGDSGYCAVVRDITQWKRAEEELTQARSQAERASSQKTEFLARVSHEIRTPLNAIIGFSELMMDEKFGPIGSDRYRDYLRDINRSGNHVLDLVNDLLDISKIEAGEQEMNYEAVSLNDTLAESVAMMQPQANRNRVIIRSSLSSRLPEVVADLRSVRQIALNLLSNAIRYTQAGGQVIISTSYEPSGDVIMRVRDTGIGMSLAEIDQALKPFKQINALKRGRSDGTGLGLPLTKAMVEANRALFTILSTPGEGTLVEITFPSVRVLAD